MKKTENFNAFLMSNKLSRREMKHVVAGLSAFEDGGVKQLVSLVQKTLIVVQLSVLVTSLDVVEVTNVLSNYFKIY